MSFNRWAKQIDRNQKMIVEILRKRGFQVFIIGRPFDLLVARKGKMALVEIKDPEKKGQKNEFTKAQLNFLKDWTGPAIFVLYTTEEAIKFELPN